MGATEHQDAKERADPARRRFVTRRDVEDAAASGRPIRVQARDVVTDEAAQRAADLGVRIERPDQSRPPNAAAAPPAATGDPSPVEAGSGKTARRHPPRRTTCAARFEARWSPNSARCPPGSTPPSTESFNADSARRAPERTGQLG